MFKFFHSGDLIQLLRFSLICALLFTVPCFAAAEDRAADIGLLALDVQPSSAPGGPIFGSVTAVNYGSMISMSRRVAFYLSVDEISVRQITR